MATYFRYADDNRGQAAFTSGNTGTEAENSPPANIVYVAHAQVRRHPNKHLSYRLDANVADNNYFTINASTGAVTFKASPDYEGPHSNTYSIVVTASDGHPRHTVKKAVTITVTDVNDHAPVFNSGTNATTAENVTTTVYTAHATDGDGTSPNNTVHYSLAANVGDNNLFNIDANTGAVTFKTAPDYEHPTGANGNNVYDVTVTATDGGKPAQSATQTVHITVTDANDNAPVFASSTASASEAENTPASTIVYTAHATDADGTSPNNSVTYSLSGNDAGKFDIDATSGAVTFKASPDYEAHPAPYQISVVATDGGSPARSSSQAVTITVTDVNDNAPVFTSSATPSVNEGTTAVVNLTTTDADTVGNNPPTFSVTGGADAAQFTIVNGNQLQLITAKDYESQPHSYHVQVTANDGANTTTQLLTVGIADVAPSAPTDANGADNHISAGSAQGTSTGVTASSMDPAGGTVTYSLLNNDGGHFQIDGTTGIVTAGPNPLTYDSANPANNTRMITVQAADPSNAASTHSFSITVDPDAPPVVTAGHSLAYAENQAATTLDPAITVTDSDSPNLAGATVQITGNYVSGQDLLGFSNTAHITGSFDMATGTLTLTGADTVANYQAALQSVTYQNTSDNPSGAARTVTIIANDGTVGSDPATDTINVTPINDAPTATNLSQSLTIDEDAAATNLFTTAPTVSDVDSPTVTATLTISAATGVLTGAGTATASGGNLVYAITDTPANVSAALAAVKYDSADNYNGMTSVSVTIDDGHNGPQGTNPTGSVSITVNSVNDAPQGTDKTISGPGGHTFTVDDFGFSDPNDVPPNMLAAVKIDTLPADGTLDYNGTAITQAQVNAGYEVSAADIGNGLLKFTPGSSGSTVSFTFQVRDDGGTDHGGQNTDQSPNTITLSPNAPPVANDDATTATEGGGTNNTGGSDPQGNVITGAGGHGEVADTDDQGAANLTVVAVGTGAEGSPDNGTVGALFAGDYGSLTLSSNGHYEYNVNQSNAAVQALNVGDHLTDRFHYTIQDGGGLQDTATITVTINGANDSAVISGTTSGTVTEAGAANGGTPTASGTLTDTDVDNAPNTFTAVTTATASTNHYGTYTMTSGGIWTYNLDNTNATVNALQLGQSATDTFTVTTVDGTPQTITITINGANDAPTANNDSITTNEDTATPGLKTTLLANDTDPEHDTLTITAVGAASHGTVALNGGNPIYTPGSDYAGQDSFTYTISDGHGGTSTATAHVDIYPIADNPTITTSTYTTTATAAGEVPVNDATPGEQLQPAVAALSDGGYVVTFKTHTNGATGTNDIHFKIYNADGTVRVAEKDLTTNHNMVYDHASVIGLSAGGFVVALHSFDPGTGNNGSDDIQAVYVSNTGAVGTPFFITSHTDGGQNDSPSINALNDGSLVVTYSVGEGNAVDIQSAHFSLSNGAPVGLTTSTVTNDPSGQDTSDITPLANGGYAVTWESYIGTVSSGDSDIFARLYDAAGNPTGAEFKVNTFTSGLQQAPSIAGLANGNFVVAWDSNNEVSATSAQDVYVRIFDPTSNHNPITAEIPVNTITAGYAGGAAVVALPDGGFVVTWNLQRSDGTYDVEAQRFDASGDKIGSEFTLNQTTTGYQTQTPINDRDPLAILKSGQLAATYLNDPTNSNTDVDIRLFNLDGDGKAGTPIKLTTIQAMVGDTNNGGAANGGSETINSIILSNFPAGTVFSLGHSGSGGTWVIDGSDLTTLQSTALTVTTPSTYHGEFDLHVQASVTDTATLSGGTTATDTRTLPATPVIIPVGVVDPGDPVLAVDNAGTFSLHLDKLPDADTVTISALPTNGHVQLADGTDVQPDAVLSATQFAGLKFTPNTVTSDTVSNFEFTVSDGKFAAALTIPVEVLHGTESGTTLTGTALRDVIVGGPGADTLVGNGGGNFLTGGGGADTFVFESRALADAKAAVPLVDHVTDYSAAQGDKLDFTALFAGTANPSAHAANLVHVTEEASGTAASVSVNVAGPNAAAHWVEIAHLDGVQAGQTVDVALDAAKPHQVSHIHVDGLAHA